MGDDLGGRIARNLKQLREARGLTQEQMSKLAEVSRAAWTNLESGAANPTLAVIYRAASALQVSIEELLSTPTAACEFFPVGSLTTRTRGSVRLRRLLPHRIPGMEMDRMELPAGGRMTGIPHTPGTREYLTCETGEIVLYAAGERWHLHAGDMIAFRGDQRHSYANPGPSTAIGYSVVVLAAPD